MYKQTVQFIKETQNFRINLMKINIMIGEHFKYSNI